MSEQPEKIQIATERPSQALCSKVQEILPGAFIDGVLDVEKLAALLGVETTGNVSDKERFGLMWAGRKNAVTALQAPSMASLAPDYDNSLEWDTAKNVFIEGDNLEVLKLLQKAYNDQIDMIYIDPPYNTGNDFVYRDDFSDTVQRYLEVSGQVDGEGNRLIANTDVSGRKHSNWITMIYPRLLLARNLLTQGGAIFVSIDDNEVSNLRLLLDEIFGAENFVACLSVALNPKGRQLDAFFATSHEYVLIYARNISLCVLDASSTENVSADDFPQVNDLGQRFRFLPLRNTNHKFNPKTRPNLYYPLYGNTGSGEVSVTRFADSQEIFPTFGDGSDAVWRWSRDLAEKRISELRCRSVAGRSGSRYDIFQMDVLTEGRKKKYRSALTSEVIGSNDDAIRELKEFGQDLFPTPKPTKLLSVLLQTMPRNALVMDFFAGSGSLGHAVLEQNQRDGGNRRFILVNENEPTSTDSAAWRQGFKSIDEIALHRLRVVSEKVDSLIKPGLRSLRVSPSSFVNVARAPEADFLELSDATLCEGAKDDLIAAEVLLKLGVRLDEQWGRTTYATAPVIRAGGVSVVLGREATHEVVDAALEDNAVHTVVFLEDSFAGRDEVKANAYFGFKRANKTMKTV